MKVVILAGGLGTRLAEETVLKPKPMVEIGGMPIIWHIMKHYSYYGFNEFVILLGYKGEVIKNFFINYAFNTNSIKVDMNKNSITSLTNNQENWTVSLIDTGSSSLTATRLKLAQPFLNKQTFLLTYGDAVSNIDIKKLIDHHNESDAVVTLSSVQPDGRWGALNIDDDTSQVTKFSEKLKGDGSWINGGYFVCENEIFDYIDYPKKDLMLEDEPLEQLAIDNKLYTYKHHGFWKCMDTLKDKNDLNEMFNKNAPWVLW